MIKFFKSVGQTMKDTTWPTAKETRHDTWTVISYTIIFAVYFIICDLILTFLLNKFIF
ncbi:MAG: preprotein translocase subunit SecE [Lactobacillaceae bacterium]|nr:preprotein translocase subunit SecE [Bombilactobacillus mellifer]